MEIAKVALAPQKRAGRITKLSVMRPETSFLAGAAVAFSITDRLEAQRFHDALMAARDRWLREKGRRLPHPDQLERERYGIRRGGGRHD
jgi:hypothetical protein